MENILRGPPLESNFPDETLGKIFFEKLKEKSQSDDVIFVNHVTRASLTYKELFEKTVKLAKSFAKIGVGKGDIVGIVSYNSVDYSVPIIACYYVGATITPINPQYTDREIKNAFDITKPKIVFTQEANVESLEKLKRESDYLKTIILMGPKKKNVENFDELLNEDIGDFQLEDLNDSPKELVAAVLSSSGTTGTPKGVMLTHENFKVAFTYFLPNYAALKKGAVTVIVIPFFHIFGYILNMACILYESKLVFLEKFHPQTYLEAMQRHKITNLFVVPTLAQFLAKNEMVNNYDLTSLTDIVSSAAPLGAEIETLLFNRFNVAVRQTYAMTETCTCITMIPKNVKTKPGSSGKILHGQEIKIADIRDGKPLGPNQRGEICCKSLANMKGYFGNPKATEEIFDNDGFLHSGDIGYYDEEGYFFIVDRLKELIKYKGYQVAPSELEDILISHPDIKDAGVVGIPDEIAGELPMAFVVKNPGSHVDERSIQDYVAGCVSVHKRLSGGVRFIDEIPKGGSGKILRTKLRELI